MMEKDKKPLVSIICPCYNAGAALDRMIQNVLAQTFRSYELIVVDGLSIDRTTLDILEKYTGSIVLIRERDKGIYDAMNKGVERACGDWIYFVGADDSLHSPFVLEHIFGSGDVRPQGGQLIVGRAFFGGELKSYCLNGRVYLENPLLHQAVFYSREVFSDFRYNQDFRVSSDYDLNFHCYVRGYMCRYTDVVICDFSLKGVSSQVHWRSYAEEIAVREKYMPRNPLRYLLALYSVARYGGRKILSQLHRRG